MITLLAGPFKISEGTISNLYSITDLPIPNSTCFPSYILLGVCGTVVTVVTFRTRNPQFKYRQR